MPVSVARSVSTSVATVLTPWHGRRRCSRRRCRRRGSMRRRPRSPAGPAHVVVRGPVGCLRHPMGERLDREGGVVAGHPGWMGAASGLAGRPPLTDEVFVAHLQGRATIGIIRCSGATRAPCWHVTSTRGRGCLTRAVPRRLPRERSTRRVGRSVFRKRRPRLGFLDGPVAATDAW